MANIRILSTSYLYTLSEVSKYSDGHFIYLLYKNLLKVNKKPNE